MRGDVRRCTLNILSDQHCNIGLGAARMSVLIPAGLKRPVHDIALEPWLDADNDVELRIDSSLRNRIGRNALETATRLYHYV